MKNGEEGYGESDEEEPDEGDTLNGEVNNGESDEEGSDEGDEEEDEEGNEEEVGPLDFIQRATEKSHDDLVSRWKKMSRKYLLYCAYATR